MPGEYKESFKSCDSNDIALSIYNCGLESCTPGHTWGPGVRDHYLIHLVISGTGCYTANNKQYTLEAGDLFFAKPNLRITYSADAKHPWEYYWVGYNGANAANLAQLLPLTEESPVYRCENPERARELLHSIYLARGPEAYQEAAMVGYLYLFLALLGKEANTGMRRPLDAGAQYVQDAIKYIQFNYSHNIGVDDIARAVKVSRSHLYRVFISHAGQSPIDYLSEYRICEACSLLANSTLTIAEIAYSVGFEDQFYFSRVFKKMRGVPPSKYVEKILPHK